MIRGFHDGNRATLFVNDAFPDSIRPTMLVLCTLDGPMRAKSDSSDDRVRWDDSNVQYFVLLNFTTGDL